MLGMMAGYGIAEGRADETPALGSDTIGTTGDAGALAPTPVPTTLSTTPATSPPQVIVVVIDGETGRPIDADAVALAAVDGDLAGGTPGASDAPPATAAVPTTSAPDTPDPPAAPAPAPAPQPVAVAVDVPTPVPVAASAPAPAPQPEATSSGS
jgi:hypothetical protein